MQPTLSFESTSILVKSWPDPVIDNLGFDPRSAYVERFWLGVLGPSTTWLLRRIASELDDAPEGFDLDLTEVARSLGLGDRQGRNSPFLRAINRTVQFEMAMVINASTVAVRRHLPPLSRRHLARLSDAQQRAHLRWQDDQLAPQSPDQQRRRSRQLALSLLELGEDIGTAELQLLRWRYHPALARDSAQWAWNQIQASVSA